MHYIILDVFVLILVRSKIALLLKQFIYIYIYINPIDHRAVVYLISDLLTRQGIKSKHSRMPFTFLYRLSLKDFILELFSLVDYKIFTFPPLPLFIKIYKIVTT